MTLSIIIPLYNEESSVLNVLNEIQSVRFPDFLSSFEVIVVDDCSKDNSFASVEQFKLRHNYSHLKLYKHDYNQAKGAAIRTGARYATGSTILIQDSDLELSPKDIPLLLNAMQELKVPFINGSRYMPGVLRTQAAFSRYFANKLFTLLTSIFINVHLTDMACGYKLLTKELFDRLHLKENRFGFEAELLIKCGRLHKNWIAEVPVRYFPRNEGEGKKLKNIDGFRILKTIVKYGLLRMN